MRIDIHDQVALVTGSAHRVGKAIALELARRGVHILVHYNSTADEIVKETLREIKSHGVEAFPIQADISQRDGVSAVFNALRQYFGRLHILVNSASNFQKRTLMEVSLEDWEETLRINVTAPLLCTQAAVPFMRANDPPGGCIINIGDKRALAAGADNIRVNTIIPGLVLKPPDYSEATWQANAERVPLQRPGSAEDVARAVAYLCSEDWLSGVTLNVDGGEYTVDP